MPRPVRILLTFANENAGRPGYLRALPEEVRAVRRALEPAQAAGLCAADIETNVDVHRLVALLQDPAGRAELAIFHYAGHADGDGLFVEGDAAPQVAHADGLARLLGGCPALELVFLNGCSTRAQVDALLANGVPAVIATGRAIEDAAATRFAEVFYARLAEGRAIGDAFRDAEAAVRTGFGAAVHRGAEGDDGATRMGRRRRPREGDPDALPWRLHINDGADDSRRWSLPLAADDPLFGLPPLPDLDLPLDPFPHLEPFHRERCAVFFGRSHDIRALYDALTEADRPPIVVLYGPSGAGKTSLLEAGVFPRLEGGHAVHVLRRDRVVGLPRLMRRLFGLPDDGGPDEGEALRDAWTARERADGRPLILLVDQLEEAVTRPLDDVEDELGWLLGVLSAVFGKRAGRPAGRVLLSLRTEWTATLLARLGEARLAAAPIELRHLDRDAVAEVVRGPCATQRLRTRYRLSVEPALPETIAEDLVADSDAAIAPTLAVLLANLWRAAVAAQPAAPRFGRSAYQRVRREGLHLDDFIGEQLAAIGARHPRWIASGLALDVLAHHTTPLGTAEVHRAEALFARYDDSALPDLLDALTNRRLLTGTARLEGGAPQGTSRLAHDTLGPLIRRRFEASDTPGQRAARVLRARVVDWRGGAEGDPLDDADLATVEAGRDGMPALDADAARLVAASRTAAARRARDRRRARLVGVVALLAVLVGAVTGWFFWGRAVEAREEADRQTGIAKAEARRADERATEASFQARRAEDTVRVAAADRIREQDPAAAAMALVEAHDPDAPLVLRALGDAISRRGLVTDVLEGPDTACRVAFTPDGERLGVVFRDGQVAIWRPRGSVEVIWLTPFPEEIGPFPEVAFDRRGHRFAATDTDRTARVWLSDGTGEPRVLAGHEGVIHTIDFGPDGERVVTASQDGTARIWSVHDGAAPRVLTGHGGAVWSAVFDPKGQRVLTASADGTARIWRVDGQGAPIVLSGHTAAVNNASFDTSGDRVATASQDGTVRVWRADGSGSPLVLTGGGPLRSVGFDTAGERVHALGQTRLLRWHLDRPDRPDSVDPPVGTAIGAARFDVDAVHVLTRRSERVTAWALPYRGVHAISTSSVLAGHGRYSDLRDATFGPRGRRVATASTDDTVRLWRLEPPPTAVELRGHQDIVRSAVFSPDGQWVLTASEDHTAALWSVDGGAPIRALTGHEEPVVSAVFAPDGQRIATASADGTARVWSVAGEALATLAGHTEIVHRARFSPDGERVLTADAQTVRIWRADGQGAPVLLEAPGRPLSADFGPKGAQVLTVHGDGRARIWSLDGRAHVLADHGRAVRAAAFSPDGRSVATLSADDMLRLGPVDGGRPPRSLPAESGAGEDTTTYRVLFDPDGTRILALLGQDIRLWSVADDASPVEFESVGAPDSWVAFHPDGSRLAIIGSSSDSRLATLDGFTLLASRKHGRGLAFSPDGARVVVPDGDIARVEIVGGALLQQALDAHIRWCMPEETRARLFGESPDEARAAWSACRERKGLPTEEPAP